MLWCLVLQVIGQHDFNATYVLEFFRLQAPSLLSSVALPLQTLQDVYNNISTCHLELHGEKNTTAVLQTRYNSTLFLYKDCHQQKEADINSVLSSCARNITLISQQSSAQLLEAEVNCSMRLNASQKAMEECSHSNSSSSLLPMLVATVKNLNDCQNRAQVLLLNLTACSNDVTTGKAETADCRSKLNTSTASLALSQASHLAAKNELRRVGALVTTLLGQLDNESRILSSVVNTTSHLNDSLTNCNGRNTALMAAVTMYKALLVDARNNLTLVESLLRASKTTTTTTLQPTTQARSTTSSTDWHHLLLRIGELEEREGRLEKNITWHHKRLEHATAVNGVLLEQLTTSGKSAWTVIKDSSEGRILIGLVAGFFLLSLFLIAYICRLKNTRHVNRSTDAFQHLTEDVVFGRRKYSTTEKPMLNGEVMEMEMHY